MKTPKSYDDDYDGIGSSDVQDEYDPPALPDLPAVIADGQLYDDDGCEIPTEEFSWLLSDTEDSEDSDGDTPDDDADAYEGTDTDTGIDEQILSSYLQLCSGCGRYGRRLCPLLPTASVSVNPSGMKPCAESKWLHVPPKNTFA